MLKNVSISFRLSLQIAISVVAIFVLVGLELNNLRGTLIEQRKESVRQIVETASSIADYYHRQGISGAMTADAAKAAAGDAIRALRYGDGNYLYVYNLNGVTEIHGTRKELEGQYRFDEKDADGKQFIHEQTQNARNGGGYTNYRFTKPGSGNKALPKISYDAMFQPWDWVIGSGIYVDDIDAVFEQRLISSSLAVLGILVLLVLVTYLLSRSVVVPIRSLTGTMDRLAGGDLDADVREGNRGDELGKMARSLQVFKENLIRVRNLEADQNEQKRLAEEERKTALRKMADVFETEVGSVVQTVTSAAVQLQSSAKQMAASASQTSSEATTVASAAEQASSNVQTVASAAEQLTASINEISDQVGRSHGVAERAGNEARQTTELIERLSANVVNIGEIVALIDGIAAQTNLLALNATIEAARAGDAGKGFAVVASEVKNLASQTAKATSEIGAKIGVVQTGTAEAVKAIAAIADVINEMGGISASVASAVQEQTAATGEIARGVDQAAIGTQEVSRSIGSVETAARETGQTAHQITEASGDLSKQADLLKREVGRFLEQVRSDGNNMGLAA